MDCSSAFPTGWLADSQASATESQLPVYLMRVYIAFTLYVPVT